MYRRFLALGHKGFLIFEDWLNRIFSPRFNPMYYLGAIAFLFTWIVFISGLYLMFIYSISVSGSHKPGGLKSEGASYAYEKVVVTPGVHRITIRMSDTNSKEKFDYIYERDLGFKPGRQICIDFDGSKKEFYIRK